MFMLYNSHIYDVSSLPADFDRYLEVNYNSIYYDNNRECTYTFFCSLDDFQNDLRVHTEEVVCNV